LIESIGMHLEEYEWWKLNKKVVVDKIRDGYAHHEIAVALVLEGMRSVDPFGC